MICISMFLIFIGAFMLGGLTTYRQFYYEWYHKGYVQGNKDGWKECEECWLSMTTKRSRANARR